MEVDVDCYTILSRGSPLAHDNSFEIFRDTEYKTINFQATFLLNIPIYSGATRILSWGGANSHIYICVCVI